MVLGKWKLWHVFAAWFVYWVALLVYRVGPPLVTVWRIKHTNGHGSVSVNYSGSAVMLALAAFGPPLLLLLLWLATRPPRPIGATASRGPSTSQR